MHSAKRENILIAALFFVIFLLSYHILWYGHNKCLCIDHSRLVELGIDVGNLKSEEIASSSELVNGSQFTSQDDVRVLNYIRKYHLQPPSPSSEPYNLTIPVHNGGVLQYITKLFNNKRGGFFIECGAYNGELLSNSLLLEKDYGWTGLLVEADKENVNALRMKKRKAWISDICLSPVPYPVQFNLEKEPSKTQSHLAGYMYRTSSGSKGASIAQCFPLYSVLKAMDLSVVDYFSLDVEGAELPILKTFPFDDTLVIKVISLEYRGNKLEDFDSFLQLKGYRRLAAINESYHTMDAVYAHESFPG